MKNAVLVARMLPLAYLALLTILLSILVLH
jgi:hypothetical protein